ncbi:MAG: hypothetical protein OFPI_00470 [Osedax symbiont Rs2]|nr:MAG: hypothetical protein OFPI_00470 [Osedax symbiont Rs2]
MEFRFLLLMLITALSSCASDKSPLDYYLIQAQLHTISVLPEEQQSIKIIALLDSNPIYSYEIVKYLLRSKIVPNGTIKRIVKQKNISINQISSNVGASPVVITPLFHSASITINPVILAPHYYLQYKQKGNMDWKPSLKFYHDSISDSFTTSIFSLIENTDYEIRISKDKQFNQSMSYIFTTKTIPHFSDNNTFLLSNIYHGGTLDLVKLDISGSKNNWVRIIGDKNTVISTTDSSNSAINIGSNSYIYFENITINGGGRNAISSNKSHHLWFNGCNISNWGRKAHHYRGGKAYAEVNSDKAINYDSAFSLIRTGVVTIENCLVYSPRTKANAWKNGHPKGANAVLVDASHPIPAFQGQIVIRENRFFGTDKHRFNDIIESRRNGSPYGGFVRDSAIYNNYLAFSNDDIIEIDGSQSNILVYNNEIEQGFVGISAIPNRRGPSFIFNNHIHNLGDQYNNSWAAIKLGGLVSRPAGKVFIFNNLIISDSNGIASAKFGNDSTFWLEAWSNIIIVNGYKKNFFGYSVLEKSPFFINKYHNNLVFNCYLNLGLIKVKYNHTFTQNNHISLPFEILDLKSKNAIFDSVEMDSAIIKFSDKSGFIKMNDICELFDFFNLN